MNYLSSVGERNRVAADELTIRGNHWARIVEYMRGGFIELGRGCRRSRPTPVQAARIPNNSVVVRRPGTNFRPTTVYCKIPESPIADSRGWRSSRTLYFNLGDRDDSLSIDLEDRGPEAVGLNSDSRLVAFLGSGVDVAFGGNETDIFCTGNPVHARAVSGEQGCRDDDLETGSVALPIEVLHGEKNHDLLQGGEGKSLMMGGDGDDVIDAGGGIDSLDGNTGDDNLDGGPGDDYIDTSITSPDDGVQEWWVGGNDTIDGGGGYDVYGFAYTDGQVVATGNSTQRNGREGAESDSYSDIELLQLSRGNDSFTGPIGGFDFSIQALSGDDRIDISGDRSSSFNDSVDCGDGQDSAAIDVNRPHNSGMIEPVGNYTEIQEDGASHCEQIDYRAR